ncbi:MAG: flagellar assembly protein FliW [Planctomycetes bacterium]|nr:flagellar assembly protein FliW [Planctomycetota bacterium]
MKISTTRFGEIEVAEGQVYAFPEGILGFADLKRYAVFAPKAGPFQWLQSAEMPSLAFVVTDPSMFFPDYRVQVRPEDLAAIRLSDTAQGVVLVILTVPRDPKEITANLVGPLVFNAAEKLARQMVLADPKYATKHRLFPG